MTVPVAQNHRCVLQLPEVTSGNALYSGVTSFSIDEVAGKLVDHAITYRYASGLLRNQTISRSKTFLLMLSCLASGRLESVYLLIQRVDQLGSPKSIILPGLRIFLSRRHTMLHVHLVRDGSLHPPTRKAFFWWDWERSTHRSATSSEWSTTGATSAAIKELKSSSVQTRRMDCLNDVSRSGRGDVIKVTIAQINSTSHRCMQVSMLEMRRRRFRVSSDDPYSWLIEDVSWTESADTTRDTKGSQEAGLDEVWSTSSRLDDSPTAIVDSEDSPRS